MEKQPIFTHEWSEDETKYELKVYFKPVMNDSPFFWTLTTDGGEQEGYAGTLLSAIFYAGFWYAIDSDQTGEE